MQDHRSTGGAGVWQSEASIEIEEAPMELEVTA
jgi:hypothetical protein